MVPPPRSPYVFIDPTFSSRAFGVAQPASLAASSSVVPGLPTPADPRWSELSGVGHGDKPKPLSDVRRADARSAEIDSPDGVVRCFQVSVNKIEPTEAVLARNLLAVDDARAALRDELEPRRPQVPLISKPNAFACLAERLAGARTCPYWTVVRPPGEAQRVAPDADAGKEVALSEPGKVAWSHILD